MSCCLEAAHFLLAQSRGLVQVLCSIVEPFVLPMLHSRQDLTFGCPITLQLIGDNHAWRIRESFEQFPKESCGCFFVASALHQDIQHVAILIDRSPKEVFLATDGKDHLIHMPFVTTMRATTAQFIRIRLPKLQTPLSNR